MSLHWVVQNNLFNEDEYATFIDTLDRLAINYTIVKVRPFDHQLEPDIQPAGHVFIYGGTTLSDIARDRGWYPGTFLNDNHDYRVWQKRYGHHLLNYDSRIAKFKDVENIWDPFFIRPCADSKTFAGEVFTWVGFKEWQHKVISLKETYTTLDGETMIMYSPVQDIWAEYRFFIIDGKIATASLYKRGSRIVRDALIDDAATRFAEQMIAMWTPARGFVLDIALTDDGYKIIEINCLNSAGLYAANVQKLIEAIDSMPC